MSLANIHKKINIKVIGKKEIVACIEKGLKRDQEKNLNL